MLHGMLTRGSLEGLDFTEHTVRGELCKSSLNYDGSLQSYDSS